MIKRAVFAGFAMLVAATSIPTPAAADPPWAREREWEHRRFERERWRERHEDYRRDYYRPGYYRPPPPVYYAPPPRPYYPPPGVYIPFR